MLMKNYNRIVEFRLAINLTEVDQLEAELSDSVVMQVRSVLRDENADARPAYDPDKQRVYYFSRQGPGLVRWSWNDIRTDQELRDLLEAILGLDQPLNPKSANRVYTKATGRDPQ